MKNIIIWVGVFIITSKLVLADVIISPIQYSVPAAFLSIITILVGLLVIWAYKKIRKIAKKDDDNEKIN